MPRGVIVDGEEDLGKQLLCVGCSEYYPMDKEFFANKRKPICRACVADGVFIKQTKLKGESRRWKKATPPEEQLLEDQLRNRRNHHKYREARLARQKQYYEENKEARLAKMREYNERNREVIKQRQHANYLRRKASGMIRRAAATSPQPDGGGGETIPAVSTSSETFERDTLERS